MRSDAGAAAAYQVLSASLQPGSSLEFVVAAAAPASADASVGTPAGGVGQLAPAELARIVISDHGVHEVRSGAPSGADAATAAGGAAAAPSPRRLLTVGGGLGEIKGVVFDVATGACSGECTRGRGRDGWADKCAAGRVRTPRTSLPDRLTCPPACPPAVAGPGGVPGTCTSAANLIGCPLKPTCGASECQGGHALAAGRARSAARDSAHVGGSRQAPRDPQPTLCPSINRPPADGKLYGGPCEARAAGTTPVCVGCKPSDCPGGTGTLPFDASGGRPAPGGTGAGVQQARRRVWTAVAASTALGQPDKAGAAAAQGKPNRRRAA